ncbi:MAG: sensor histidine kinase [Kofleriaceae bacterium]
MVGLYTAAAAAIPALVALPLVWTSDLDLKARVTLTLVVVLGGGGCALAARARTLRPLQTLANLIAALRERDYSVRGRAHHRGDALGLVMAELAALAEQLRDERWRDEEAATGLARVVERLDAAVIAVDSGGIVRLANRTAERLAGQPLQGTRAADVGLATLLEGDAPRTVQLELPGARGTWEVRPSEVRLSGMPHKLVVMTDVQHALRAEEQQAWQRLVRVLGHEINNSLGPIASIAETLRTGLAQPRRPDLDDDLARGLEIIERRAAALARFMQAYARLVRLPPPRPSRVDVAEWIARTAELERGGSSVPVELSGGPPLAIPGDPDQLDQLLINLVHNAVEASAETGGQVRVHWRAAAGSAIVTIEDDGHGVAETANLFVPFFTTKPGGSGIGLVLARQIAEAHGGSLVLRNRASARGAEAVITLPATSS